MAEQRDKALNLSKVKVNSFWAGKWFGLVAATSILVLQTVLIVYAYTSTNAGQIMKEPEWSNWEIWVECTVSCGSGSKISLRNCIGDTEEQICKGDAIKREPCQITSCDVDGGWSEWRAKGACSVTCGKGEQQEDRSCTNPSPFGTGKTCQGEELRTVECSIQECLAPIHGGWTEWHAAGECSKSCGYGTQVEIRTCTNPIPQHGGDDCSGNHTRTANCSLQECLVPIDGGWSSWTMSSCSATCGNGTQIRERACNNPAPANGGSNCIGEATETNNCTQDFCTGWGEWSNVTECSVTCGNGTFKQDRTCQLQPPANCTGPNVQELSCTLLPCPVNGGWSEWTETSDCTVTCGGGQVSAERTCTNPEPQYGGLNCTGNSTGIIACNSQECTEISDLVRSEDGGDVCATNEAENKYVCAFPFVHEGQEKEECIFDQVSQAAMCPVQLNLPSRTPVQDQWYKCDTRICPVAGGWSNWIPINLCSVSCGGGVVSEKRSCLNPPPLNGGSECQGESQRLAPCNERPCIYEQCKTVSGGPIEDTPCILPFVADNIMHNDCIYEGQQRPWCAAFQTMQDGSLIPNYWGYCNMANCPVQGGWNFVPFQRKCPCNHPNSSLIMTQRCEDPMALNGGTCSGEPEEITLDCSSTDEGSEGCLYTQCGGTIVGERGTITSPNYPAEYPIFSWCEWNITVPSGQRVLLSFEMRNTETDFDIISLHLLEQGTKTLTGEQKTQESYVSSREAMLVRFESDGSVNAPGFIAHFSGF